MLIRKALNIYVLTIIFYFSLSQSFAAGSESELDQLLALPEEKIDIGIAALTLAKEIYPDLDVKTYSEKIDEMAAGARALTKGNTDPDYRIRALNTYLYKITGIKYDKSDPTAEKLENRYLNGIIDNKRGSCLTMPLFYLSVAQRLRYPVYPVAVPQHFFLRYIDPQLKMQNIEATNGGGYSPNDEYREVLQISKRGIENGAYLRTLTYREFFADLVTETAIYWATHKDYKKAIHYLEKCIMINPKSPEIYNTLGRVYVTYGRKLAEAAEKETAQQYISKAEVCFQKAEELGIVKLSSKNYVEEQSKAQEKYRRKHKQKEKQNEKT